MDIEKRKKQLAEARKWHQTPEGKKVQSEGTKKSWDKRRLKPYSRTCLGCRKKFDAFQRWAKYCSDACCMRHRRRIKRLADKKSHQP